jgi:Spy/CpxP family protein refolding chaperone
MNIRTRLTPFAAALAAIVFAAASPSVMAGQTTSKAQQVAWGYGMGPGMMGGYGMGPGMMGYYGTNPAMARPYGMGPGMMAGAQSNWSLDLTPAQQGEIGKIREETGKKQWDIMNQMWGEMAKLRGLYSAQTRDDKAISSAMETVTGLRQQMFENMVTARKQMESVLTKEQLEKLRGFRPMASAPAAAAPAK